MRVCLVHHAEALGPSIDPQRPLSSAGVQQAAWLATSVAGLGFTPAAIWHSGKLRSRQTAEAFLRVSPFADFRMVRGLRPDDPPSWIHHELDAETRDILLVGHMPYLPDLARALAGAPCDFPVHGMIGFERDAGGPWREFARAQPR